MSWTRAPWLIYSDWLLEQGRPDHEVYWKPRVTIPIGYTGITMQFQLIPPGSFLMDRPEQSPKCVTMRLSTR